MTFTTVFPQGETPEEVHRAWLEQRAKGIGGSDAGAILGLNKYTSALDVWMQKTGQAPAFEGNEATYWGHVHEDAVAKRYAERTGNKVRKRLCTFISAEYPWMQANIDRDIVGQKKGLECKTASEYVAGQWGEEFTDEVPDSYLAQVAHYMVVMGWEEMDLAVLIGGNKHRIYTITQANPSVRELMDILIEVEREFWHDNVLLGIAPKVSMLHDLDTVVVDPDKVATATAEQVELYRRVKDLDGQLKPLKKERDELVDKLKLFTADAANLEYLMDDEQKPLATFKRSKDKQAFQTEKFAEAHPDMYRKFLAPKKGSRRFLIK